MIRMFSNLFSLIAIAAAFVSTATGCISYPAYGGEIRMELPAFENDSSCIIEYSGYTVCYDEASRIPVWVAYELTQDEVDGTVSRSGKYFRPDDTVNTVQADNSDYRGSGWSRGHMAPAGDFKWSDQAMWDTFYYTNCCPQDEKLNSGSWNVLENKVRIWARKFGRVYVVTGPIIGRNQGGKIGFHEIVVPDAFFKAVLVYSGEEYHSIGFVMFNNSDSQKLIDSYLSINDLEKLTALDFFPAMDDSMEEQVEGTVDLALWDIR